MGKGDTRTEPDTMGQVTLPAWAYWGAQTHRAVKNFCVSDKRIPSLMFQVLGLIKQGARCLDPCQELS